VTLTFDQIEGILGFAPPASARSRPSVSPLGPHMASPWLEPQIATDMNWTFTEPR
jgi:hypothetical protein